MQRNSIAAVITFSLRGERKLINKHFANSAVWVLARFACNRQSRDWCGGGWLDGGRGVQGRAGLLRDPSDMDMKPFVVSSTVCFQIDTAFSVHLAPLWVHIQDSMCGENNSH